MAHGAGWQTYMVGLAFTITLSGLGWAECGNDYSRYLPPEASKKAIVGWVFLGTAVPEILVMTLGAVVGTFLASVGTSANAFLPFVHQSFIPAWFVVVFLLFAMVQLFAINSLDLYSSGVTLQALGVKVKRYQAVIIDSVICLGVTIYAIFDSSFSTYLRDFVDVVIVWIAPWVAIYLVDWGMRKWRYVPSELQRVDRGSLYWSKGGVHWPAIIAQLVGMVASMAALSPTFSVPHWVNPITIPLGEPTSASSPASPPGGSSTPHWPGRAWAGRRLSKMPLWPDRATTSPGDDRTGRAGGPLPASTFRWSRWRERRRGRCCRPSPR